MQITFLGTGASHGIPVIGCNCEVCTSENQKDKRLRSSVFIDTGKNSIIIDPGPDFRQQVLREKITRLDGILMTHEHKDHTAGIDDVRAFNYLMKRSIRFFGQQRVLDTIKQEYAYAFAKDKYPGVPEIDLCPITDEPFYSLGEEIIPIKVYHHLLPVHGFRLGEFAYLTDIKTLGDGEIEKLRNVKVLALSVLRVEEHIAHLGLDEAFELINLIKPQMTYFTHISHRLYQHEEMLRIFPSNIQPAYDGLSVTI